MGTNAGIDITTEIGWHMLWTTRSAHWLAVHILFKQLRAVRARFGEKSLVQSRDVH